MLISESNFGVQTKTIPVDFNEGRSVYDKIKEGIADKEIGILGRYIEETCIIVNLSVENIANIIELKNMLVIFLEVEMMSLMKYNIGRNPQGETTVRMMPFWWCDIWQKWVKWNKLMIRHFIGKKCVIFRKQNMIYLSYWYIFILKHGFMYKLEW